MTRTFKMLALASAVLAVPALAQSVEVKTGRNGQLSGKAEAGGVSSSVTTGVAGAAAGRARTTEDRDDQDRGAVSTVGPCTPDNRSRTVRVVSPDGSSSSSSSVSVSGGGTVSAAGGGSPGSRIIEEGCPDDAAASDRAYTPTSPAAPKRRAAHRSAPHN